MRLCEFSEVIRVFPLILLGPAQPVGIHIRILSECIRIVIGAFGSAPIPDDFRFAIGYDGDFIPIPLTRDFFSLLDARRSGQL